LSPKKPVEKSKLKFNEQKRLNYWIFNQYEIINLSWFNLFTGGANNPFLEDVAYDAAGARVEDQGQYYGRGYSQAQSGYSSSGFGKIHIHLLIFLKRQSW